MRFACRPLLIGILIATASAEPVRVIVDVSATPNAQAFVAPVKALCTRWYAKINSILFGKSTSLPYREIRVVFEPVLYLETAAGRQEAPSYTHENRIHVSFSHLAKMPDDYRAMLIHELVHVVQNYRNLDSTPARWIGEGVADYIRHRYFEKDLVPRLDWDPDDTLSDLPIDRATLRKQGYLQGYTIAARFLYWIELRKDRRIIQELSLDVRDSRSSLEQFPNRCGAGLDELWKEFLEQK